MTVVEENTQKTNIKLCECGCGKPVTFNKYRPRKFIKCHGLIGRKGFFSNGWKYGRIKHKNYWYLYMPEYYRYRNNGYIPEHVYFYEQYHKCCVLKWGEIHHIEPVTKDYCNNMIWNLQGMTTKQHMSYHHKGKTGIKIHISDTVCSICKSNKTYIGKRGFVNWYKYKDKYICNKCYCKKRRKSK